MEQDKRERPYSGLSLSYSGRYGNKERIFGPYYRLFCPYAGAGWPYVWPPKMVLRRFLRPFECPKKFLKRKMWLLCHAQPYVFNIARGLSGLMMPLCLSLEIQFDEL